MNKFVPLYKTNIYNYFLIMRFVKHGEEDTRGYFWRNGNIVTNKSIIFNNLPIGTTLYLKKMKRLFDLNIGKIKDYNLYMKTHFVLTFHYKPKGLTNTDFICRELPDYSRSQIKNSLRVLGELNGELLNV